MTVFKLSVILLFASSVSASAVSCTSDVTTGGRNDAKESGSKLRLCVNQGQRQQVPLQNWYSGRRTSTHSRIAIAAVRRTTASEPGPWSWRRWTRICQSFGLLAFRHSSDTSLPRSHAILRLTMG